MSKSHQVAQRRLIGTIDGRDYSRPKAIHTLPNDWRRLPDHRALVQMTPGSGTAGEIVFRLRQNVETSKIRQAAKSESARGLPCAVDARARIGRTVAD